MDYREPPIYKAAYEFTLAATRFVRDCDRAYKLTLGHLLQSKTLSMQTAIYEINEVDNKVLALQIALDRAYYLKMILRLFLDLNLMKLETNLNLHGLLEEVIKQLQGWKKSEKKKNIQA